MEILGKIFCSVHVSLILLAPSLIRVDGSLSWIKILADTNCELVHVHIFDVVLVSANISKILSICCLYLPIISINWLYQPYRSIIWIYQPTCLWTISFPLLSLGHFSVSWWWDHFQAPSQLVIACFCAKNTEMVLFLQNWLYAVVFDLSECYKGVCVFVFLDKISD